MKSPNCVLLVLALSSTGICKVNTKCVHPGIRDVVRNECADFVVTAGSDTFGVRLPITASQGMAVIGTMYDDKRRRGLMDPRGVESERPVVTVTRTMTSPASSQVIDNADGQNSDSGDSGDSGESNDASDSDNDVDDGHAHDKYPASLMGSFATAKIEATILHYDVQEGSSPKSSVSPVIVTIAPSHSSAQKKYVTKTSLSSTMATTSGILFNLNDKIGPGINNMPIKAITGEGKDGKKITYPNKLGASLCKKASKCITIDKMGPAKPCFDDLQEKIHLLAQHHPNLTFEAMKPIVCSPAHSSKYCAFIEIVPWQPANDKNERLMKKMDIQPYQSMEYNKVPIGAISEGVDWIKQGKAKLCGAALVPVPEPGPDRVYVLKVDIDMDLPEMDPAVTSLLESFDIK